MSKNRTGFNEFSRRNASMLTGLIASIVFSVAPALAQVQREPFTQLVVFGDSTVDSGFYRALPNPGGGAGYNALWPSAVAAGAGVPTTSPGLMGVQVLAARLGLTANPANQPGGTNYATSGAKNVKTNDGTNGGFRAAIPTASQIADYLKTNGNRVPKTALYVVSSGGNDVGFAFSAEGPATQDAKIAYLIEQANGLVAAIKKLSEAGAFYIIVPGQHYSFPLNNQALQQAKLAYTQALWSGLTASGVNFIQADFNSVRVAIANNPSAFGFQFTGSGPGQTACLQPSNVTSAWALLCSSNPAAPSHLISNADRDHLFADNEHMTTAGEKLQGDYFYSLLGPPSE